jgi:hypothetical protein
VLTVETCVISTTRDVTNNRIGTGTIRQAIFVIKLLTSRLTYTKICIPLMEYPSSHSLSVSSARLSVLTFHFN